MNNVDELLSDAHAHRPRKPRRGLIFLVIAFFAAVLVAVVVFVDGAARAFAENGIEDQIANRLPEGAGPITASVGGFSFLAQLASGSFDQLDVTFALDGEALPALAGAEGGPASIAIADDTLSYDSTVEFLGMQIGYTVTLEPSVDNGLLVLTPTAVEATTDTATVDLGQLVDLSALTIRACTADRLPKGMELTDVNIIDDRLQFHVSGQDLPMDLEALRTRGSCD